MDVVRRRKMAWDFVLSNWAFVRYYNVPGKNIVRALGSVKNVLVVSEPFEHLGVLFAFWPQVPGSVSDPRYAEPNFRQNARHAHGQRTVESNVENVKIGNLLSLQSFGETFMKSLSASTALAPRSWRKEKVPSLPALIARTSLASS